MTDLPDGWEWSTIGEVADVGLGRQRSPQHHRGPHMHPYLRSANVTWEGIDLSDVKEMNFEPTDAAAFELAPGDLLLNEASGSPNEVGKPAIWRGEIEGCCFQNTLLRVKTSGPSVDYLYWYCMYAALTGRFGEAGRGVNIRHLGKQGLTEFPVPVPPIGEQDRIVAAVEEHLSRLNAAESSIASARRRLKQLQARARDAVLVEAQSRTLGDLGIEARYGTSVKCTYESSGRAVLRIPNIVDEGIDLVDLKYASDDTAVSPSTVAQVGDVLFVRTNGSRDLIGRAAVVSEEAAGKSFASYLIRYRFGPDVIPAYVCAAVSAPSSRQTLEAMAATTAGQYNLSVSKLDRVSIPVPSLEEQSRLIAERGEALRGLDRLRTSLDVAVARGSRLRQSILAAAFSGQLVPQYPTDEPASVLLERIRSERAGAAGSWKRARKAKSA